jgi:hypothetical protein
MDKKEDLSAAGQLTPRRVQHSAGIGYGVMAPRIFLAAGVRNAKGSRSALTGSVEGI